MVEVELRDRNRRRGGVALALRRRGERLEEQVRLSEVRCRVRSLPRRDRAAPFREHRLHTLDPVVELSAVEGQGAETALARQKLEARPVADWRGVRERRVGALEEVADEPGRVAVERGGGRALVLVGVDSGRRREEDVPERRRGWRAHDVGVEGSGPDLDLETDVCRRPVLPVGELRQCGHRVAGRKQLRRDVHRDP